MSRRTFGWLGLDRDGRRRRIHGEQGAAAVVLADGGTPAMFGGGTQVGYHPEEEEALDLGGRGQRRGVSCGRLAAPPMVEGGRNGGALEKGKLGR